MEPDFTGYATKSGIRCADGRTIKTHAFQGNDGMTVPLVWQHQHDSPTNILGNVLLHWEEAGTRAEGFFNETEYGQIAKKLVGHKDIKFLSIYANNLVQQGMDVVHGIIREVSLVLSGANPGALIDSINLAHGDGVTPLEDEAIIYTGEEVAVPLPVPVSAPVQAAIQAAGSPPAPAPAAVPVQGFAPPQKPDLALLAHAAELSAAVSDPASAPRTVEDILATLSTEQREVVYALLGAALTQGGLDPASSTTFSNDPKGGSVTNVFDQTQGGSGNHPGPILSHSDMQSILDAARKGGSLKDAVEQYALAHSIDNIDLLFPDAKAVTDTPEWISRRQAWVQGVLSGTRHTPFSRIKNLMADITLDEARARGYVKGAMKREEFFAIARRTTTPQTVYKKQKLDRDDILDITDFDVVAWLKQEMRLMLDEEVARAVLIGDGRDVADPDKIQEDHIRPILTDSEIYVTTVQIDDAELPPNANKTYEKIVDEIMTSMEYFMGSGQPTLYAPRSWVTKMMLSKDGLGRRLHATLAELADSMGVGAIVPVDVMEVLKDSLVGIIVNLSDYTVGTDRGGEVSFFDDFDIDYNKFTYLYETRLSGALTKFKSAIVVKVFTGAGGVLGTPAAPTFVKTTGVVTVVDHTADHYTYVTVDDDTGEETAVGAYGAQAAIPAGGSKHYRAKPAATYAFANNAVANWTFQRPAA